MARGSRREEDPHDLQARIERLRELVLTEKDLVVRKDDNFMLRFLRCCGYDPEIAFERMKAYYGLKYQHPQWFVTGEVPPSLDDDIARGYFYILSTRDREGRCIYVNDLGQIKESKTTMAHQSRLHDIYTETIMDDEAAQKNGVCVIVDVKNVSWKLLKWLTPENVRIATKKTEIMPLTRISFHVVNTNVLVHMALKVIMPFLSNSTKENIHIHDGVWSGLHKAIDPESLPVTYGGKLNPETHKIRVDKHSERLVENLGLGYKRKPASLSS